MARKGMTFVQMSVILALIVVAVVGTAAAVTGNLPFFSGASGGGSGGGGQGGAITMVSTQDNGVNMDVGLPTTVSSADAYILTEKPETTSPVHYGDYVDFSASEATSGLTEGVDYLKVSLSSSDTATFTNPADKLGTGDVYVVLVDKSSPREYHYFFGSTEIPEQVAKYKVTNDINVDITPDAGFDRFPSYKSDSTQVLDANGDATALSADIDDPSSNVTDRVRTIERTVTYEKGRDYHGTLSVSNFNTGDGISDVEVTVTADGEQVFSKTLESGTVSELSDDGSYSKAIVDNPDTSPEKSSTELKLRVDITYDAASSVATAGDGKIGPGETMFDFEMQDIYGNTVGTAGTTSVTG